VPGVSAGTRAAKLLIAARLVSALGDFLTPVALAFAVLQAGWSPDRLGLILAARAAPGLLVLFGGVVADRFSRRRALVSAQLLGCFTQTATGLLFLTGHASVGAIAVLGAGRGICSAFGNPASTGAMQHVVPRERRQSLMAMYALASNTPEALAPLFAAVLLAVVAPGFALVVDGVTFAISAALILGAGPLGGSGPRTTTMRRDLVEGIAYVWQASWLRYLIASACVFQLALRTPIAVLGPLVAARHLGGSSAWSVIVAALGAGGLAGGFVGMRLRVRRPLLVGYGLLVLGAGPTAIALAIPAPLPMIVASEFVAGFVAAVFTVFELVVIGEYVPAPMLSRVDAVNRLGSTALRPVGLALAGPAAAAFGLRRTLLACAVMSASAAALPLLSRDVRMLSSQADPVAPAPEVAVV
jgi:hypothetical protein